MYTSGTAQIIIITVEGPMDQLCSASIYSYSDNNFYSITAINLNEI
jgi:hypothetical protein